MLERELIEIKVFDKITGHKLDSVEFGKVENMRFHKDGRGHVERLTDLGEVVEKVGVSELLLLFVDELFFDSSVFNQLCPNSHGIIIHRKREKVKRF